MRNFSHPMGRRAQGDENDLQRDMAYEYRRRAGAWLRGLREDLGYTQAQVADALGVGHTAISGTEVGRVALAPERYRATAKVLEIDEETFGKKMLRYTNPWLYQMLFGQGDAELAQELEEIPERYFPRNTPRPTGARVNEKTERQRKHRRDDTR